MLNIDMLNIYANTYAFIELRVRFLYGGAPESNTRSIVDRVKSFAFLLSLRVIVTEINTIGEVPVIVSNKKRIVQW